MLDSTNTYFFGVATDKPIEEKKRPTCPYALGDLVYYYPPGKHQGTLWTVQSWHYDENGRVIVSISRVVSGEEEIIETTLNRLHC